MHTTFTNNRTEVSWVGIQAGAACAAALSLILASAGD